MSRQTIELDGLAVSYQRRGAGTPLVLLHGFPLDADMWRHQLDALSAKCDVIAPELRGFGESELAPGDAEAGVTMRQYAADAARLLDELNVVEPVVLAGFSMGGYAAWQFALNYSDRLGGLVLCDTRAAADAVEAKAKREQMAVDALAKNDATATLAMLPKLLAAATMDSRPDVVDEIRTMMLRQSPGGIAAAQRGMAARPDVRNELKEITCPALAIVGVDDAISPAAEMREIAESLPAGQFVEIPHAGHMSPLENPTAVNAALAGFVAAIGPAAR